MKHSIRINMNLLFRLGFGLALCLYIATFSLFLFSFNESYIDEISVGLSERILVYLLFLLGILRYYFLGRKTELNLSFLRKSYPIWFIIFFVLNQLFFGWDLLGLKEDFGGVLSLIDGKRVIHNHGQIIQELNEQEYLHFRVLEFRQAMQNYLGFLGAILVLLFPIKMDLDKAD